jgi:hypothetical protein
MLRDLGFLIKLNFLIAEQQPNPEEEWFETIQ